METTESAAARSTPTTTVGGVGRFRRWRVRTTATAAQVARVCGGTATRRCVRSTRADGGHGRRSVGGGGSHRAVTVFRRRVHRDAVPGCGQRREMELPDDGRGHREERVVRARLSHVNQRCTEVHERSVHERFDKTL